MKQPFWPSALPSSAAIGFRFSPDLQSAADVLGRMRPWLNETLVREQNIDLEQGHWAAGGVKWGYYKLGFDHEKFYVSCEPVLRPGLNTEHEFFQQVAELEDIIQSCLPLFLKEEREIVMVGFVVRGKGKPSEFSPLLLRELKRLGQFKNMGLLDGRIDLTLRADNGEISLGRKEIPYDSRLLLKWVSKADSNDIAFVLDKQFDLKGDARLVNANTTIALMKGFYSEFLGFLNEFEE